MRPLLVILLPLLLLAGCTPDDEKVPASGADKGPQIADIAKDYQHLQLMTKEPVLVDPWLAMSCVGASQLDVEQAQEHSGPHANTTVSIYMNESAAKAFKESAASYPVGSIIVKEKKPQYYRAEGQDRRLVKAHDGVGGMIKRPSGYDAAHGDWEYFYFEDMAKIENGKIASCVHCHTGASGKDFVFGGWAHEQ